MLNAEEAAVTEISRNERELALVALARRVLPGGSFGNLSSDIVIGEGRAGRVWDVSGNEYVAYYGRTDQAKSPQGAKQCPRRWC